LTSGVGQPWPAVGPPGPAQAWQPRPYPQLLRGPTFRWWRPLLSILVAVAVAAVFFVAVGLGAALLRLMQEAFDPGSDATSVTDEAWLITPVGFAWTNLLLAALIPVALLATWAGYGWRPRWVSSVAPGVRWGWLVRCYALTFPVVALSVAGTWLLAGDPWAPEPRWGWLLLVVLLTTPLQAAGEEYLFRGWLPQLVGSAIPDARIGALLGGALSSTLFAFAHGEQNGWLFADRFVFGAIACWLVWRTGGLEAGIALHGANNIVALVASIGTGSLGATLQASEGSALFVLIDLATLLTAAGAVLFVARRRPPVRLFVPPPWPPLQFAPPLPGRRDA
jgi:uncharacterized protein